MVIIFLADGFEEAEAVVPADILRRAGVDAVLAGVSSKTVKGAHGIELTADKTLNQLKNETPEMVVLPGGMPGAKNLDSSRHVREMISRTVAAGGFAAAICAAPMVLGRMGLLRGKRAVCYPGFEEHLEGAELSGARVEVDGRIVTANGPGAAFDFGFALVSLLKNEDEARFIQKGMLIK